jgi:hypothetical protein
VRRSRMASAGNWKRQRQRYAFALPVDILFFIAIWYIDSRFSDGGKSIEYFLLHVRKTYGLANRGGGEERVKHLKAVYASLISKRVPNVDRLKKAEIQHRVHGSYVDLEPRGIDTGPKSPLDVRNAVVCVLEALKVVSISFYVIN